MVTEEELPYWHLKHEVLLAEAKANISNSTVEETGGSEHQDQVKVPRKGSLEKVTEVHSHIDNAAHGAWSEHIKHQMAKRDKSSHPQHPSCKSILFVLWIQGCVSYTCHMLHFVLRSFEVLFMLTQLVLLHLQCSLMPNGNNCM